MATFGRMRPKLIAKMILIAVMASAIVAPKSSGVVFELLASCRKRGHANPKVTIRHGRFD